MEEEWKRCQVYFHGSMGIPPKHKPDTFPPFQLNDFRLDGMDSSRPAAEVVVHQENGSELWHPDLLIPQSIPRRCLRPKRTMAGSRK
jgi:hypothetical protein